ncbi:PDZ domain-containing protein [Clostridium sp. SYSU_GA19001]|uniref:PDZ domain-containing protein n=1 Tax=Clostridium caldaquaticum TaxID=2940653 RepID=UPI0020776199|nr:PDZ domain-containing protein [Clostridium caldaquaticum]MCM8710168.1 PDZ domain-containing protein [Clostridium caldaquaticum]
MSILLSTLRAVAYALVDSSSMLMLILLAFILYRQNKKITVMQKMIIGESLNSAFELTISQIVIGIFAGAASSILLSFLGVAFDINSAIYLVFLISIFFMFWRPRFICFAYSGAVLGLLSLLLELISKVYAGVKINLLGNNINLADVNILRIDIGALMTFIAVMHFIEGILVIIDGKRGSIPVFTNRDNKIIGGFAFRRNWVLPIALFFIVNDAGNLGFTETIATPDWWPILGTSPILTMAKGAAVSLFAYFGIIGYSTVTFTKNREEKVIQSAAALFIFSSVLFAFSQLSYLGYMYKLFLIVFAPVAHELMLNVQRIMEVKGKPKYMSSEEGIMVLEVAPNSPAYEMGIKSGDLLLEVNDKKITNEQDILTVPKESFNYISFKLKRGLGKIHEVSYNRMSRDKKLGIVFVPKEMPGDSMVIRYDDNKFREILDKMKNKDDNDEE